jgi:ABC-2 type transport system ATP-binding protein
VGVLAACAGVVLTELSVQRGSLEDAFIRMTGHHVEYTAGGPADDSDNHPALAGAGR